MSMRSPLRMAVWVLERCGVDEPVLGDVIELDAAHPSNVQLVREVLVAVSRHAGASFRGNQPQALRRLATVAGVAWLLSYTAAGNQPVNLAASLNVVHMTTGWREMTADRTRIVPSVEFELKNVGGVPLAPVQVNVVFRRASESHDWSDAFRRAATRRNPLTPGASTPTLTVESTAGYTGDDPGARMLDNTQFVDVAVTIYARQGSEDWTTLGSYDVQRVLIGPAHAAR